MLYSHSSLQSLCKIETSETLETFVASSFLLAMTLKLLKPLKPSETI